MAQNIFRPWLAVGALLVVLSLLAQGQQLGPMAQRQIQALMREKASRTPTQRKIASSLLNASRILRAEPVDPDMPGVNQMLTPLRLDLTNSVDVDIRATVTPELLAELRRLGGNVIHASAQYGSIRAHLPMQAMEDLAARNDVAQIHPAVGPEFEYQNQIPSRRMVSRGVPRRFAPPAVSWNKPRTRKNERNLSSLARLFQRTNLAFFAGPSLSSDKAHRANDARTNYGVDGTGVKVGVISDGVDSLALEQAAGRLPASVTVLPGGAGSGDEGTAILEIIYTLAPGAQLYFTASPGNQAAMADSMQALADAGCRIIIDDVKYAREGIYQDTVIAQKANALAAAGIFVFSSAGNNGSAAKNTSGVWEGDYVDGGTFELSSDFHRHSFGATTQNVIQITGTRYILNWSDPFGQSTNDYDLVILDPAGTQVVGSSTNIQSGAAPGDPQEIIIESSAITSGCRIMILNYLGAPPRALHLRAWDGQLAIRTDGTITGHAGSSSVFAVGAADVFNAGGGPFTGGTANPAEDFSSSGPRRKFFNDDGTPITPGNFLIGTNGGTVINKPDIIAADGVETGLPSSSFFNPFYGTSAAAPHAAAIAALMLQAKPSLTPVQMKAAMAASALDIETPGLDNVSGPGIVMAPAAIAAATSAGCQYALSPGGQAFGFSGGNGTINITTLANCPWNVSSNMGWVFGNSGTGSGTANYTVSANTGMARSATVTLASGAPPFTVEQASAVAPSSSSVGSLAQIASAGTWKITMNYLNLGSAAALARMSFFGDSGSALQLPFTFPQTPSSSGPLLASSLDRTIASNAQVIMESTGPDSLPVSVGWAQLLGPATVNGFGVFANATQGWEALVPLETRNSNRYILPFDNTAPLATGVAAANLVNIAANIPVIIRDHTGLQIGNPTLNLPPMGHRSFMLDTEYAVTAGKRGTIEFQTPAGGQISILGLRANGPSLTTLPVLADVGTTGGSITHTLFHGQWTASFTLANTGAASAQATLNFFAENGSPLNVPLLLPQTGESVNATSITRTIPPGGSLLIETVGQSNQETVVGSAKLTTNGNVSGFSVFKWVTSQQEASVPLESRDPTSFVLAFDNTNGLATGLALAEVSGNGTADIPIVIRDDAGNILANPFPIQLVASGHVSFMLPGQYPVTAGKRGTIEFQTPPGRRISALGLRATPLGNVTTIPVMTK